MWKIIPFLLLFAAPVKADITHKLTSSVQLQVNAAATNVERIGSSYSVSGNNVTTQYTPDGGSATNSVGAMTSCIRSRFNTNTYLRFRQLQENPSASLKVLLKEMPW